MGKFFLALLLIFLILAGSGYYIYRTTGYKFGLDRTVLSRGTISITTQEFLNGGKIPPDFTCDGADLSPTFLLEHIPSSAKSLAIVLDDASSNPKGFTHWLAFNISPNLGSIEGSKVLGNAVVGANDFGNVEYDGPCPPAGQTHNYYFRLYALDTTLNLSSTATRPAFDDAINEHVIAKGEIWGTYVRIAN